MMTCAAGRACRIARSVSIPSRSGIRTSSRMTFGRRAAAQPLEQRGAAVEHLDAVALGAQKRVQIAGEGGVVVDDRQACGHAFPLSMGMDNARARPSPAVHTRPPSAVTRRWASGHAESLRRTPRIEGPLDAVQRRPDRRGAAGPHAKRSASRCRSHRGDGARRPAGADREQRGDGLGGAIHAGADARPILGRRTLVADRDAALGEHRGDAAGQLAGRRPA